MGIILDNHYVSIATDAVTGKGTAAGYPVVNVLNRVKLKRRYQSTSTSGSSSYPLLIFDLGTNVGVRSIVLDDINFNKFNILGNSSNMGTDWSGASYISSAISASVDEQVNRTKIYATVTTAFDYQFLAICVSSAAANVGTIANWEVGRVEVRSTHTSFTHNMNQNYNRGGEQPYVENALGETEKTGPIKWSGTLAFGPRSLAQESDLTTLNNINISDILTFYENNGDTSKVYVCRRNGNYSGTYGGSKITAGSSMKLTESI